MSSAVQAGDSQWTAKCIGMCFGFRTESDRGTKKVLFTVILYVPYKPNPYSLCKCISEFLIRFFRDNFRWHYLVFALLGTLTGLHMYLVIII